MNGIPTILIVDDEARGRQTLEALLHSQGYHLAFASNGVEALEQAVALMPDLILLDVMMPGMDGFAVCRQLRADARLAEVPIVLVTALDDRESRLQGLEAGADDFLSKPFDRGELRARVRTITRLNRYRRLQSERAKFAWVIDRSDDGHLLIDSHDQVHYLNPQAARYLGLPTERDGPLDQPFQALARRQYHCEPPQTWVNWPQPAGTHPPEPRYLVQPASSSAPAFWLQVDLTEVEGTSERLWLVRLRDVTDMIRSRTSEWTFQALIRHKLTTPLTQLNLAIEMLAKAVGQTAPQHARILAIGRASAQQLTNDLQVIFAYMEALEQANVGQRAYGLTELAPLINTIQTQLALSTVTLTYEGLDDPATIELTITPQALELILWEVLTNAKKFHPNHAPTIKVTCTAAPGVVRLCICDDGQTISPTQLAQVWRPYYQAEPQFTGQVPGMGLGLALVAALVWQVGGTCQIANRDAGVGVRVELTLPVSEQDSGQGYGRLRRRSMG